MKRRKRGKFGSRRCMIDGFTFDSQAEGLRYLELKLLVRAVEIKDLERQCGYKCLTIAPDGAAHPIGSYRADFRYYDVGKGCVVVEDVKGRTPGRKGSGSVTPLFNWKKKHVEAQYDLVIEIVYRNGSDLPEGYKGTA